MVGIGAAVGLLDYGWLVLAAGLLIIGTGALVTGFALSGLPLPPVDDGPSPSLRLTVAVGPGR